MSTGAGTPEAQRLDRLYRAKARAEIKAAERLVPGAGVARGRGDELADVLIVKGEPGPADLRAHTTLAGDDGPAAGKALDALGLPPARFAVCSRVGDADAGVLRERLRLIVEAVDPRTVLALDPHAAADLAAALGVEAIPAGVALRVGGRRVVALDGLEASLSDDALKRRVWRQMKALSDTP